METVRYGVIGMKGIGQQHIRFACQQEHARLTALVDVDATSVDKASEEFGVRGFTDYRAMLDAGIVDAVSIATPHYLHGPIGLDCLNAGVHVFIEKPLASRVSEADAMIAEAKARNLKLCVGHQYRTHRSSQAMKHLIDSGAIGHIMRVLWTWGEFRPERYYERDLWRATWQQAGGGVLMNQASHDVDLICWMVGPAVQVSALVGNQLHGAEVEDVACANVRFANGAFGAFQFTINQPRGYSVRQIAGDKGIIVIQDVKSLTSDQEDEILLGTYDGALSMLATQLTGIADQPGVAWHRVRLSDGASEASGWTKPAHGWQRLGVSKKKSTAHAVLMESFLASILGGGEPLVTGESALHAVELINAIVLAAMRKKTVDLPVDREEYDRLFEELSSGHLHVPRFRNGSP